MIVLSLLVVAGLAACGQQEAEAPESRQAAAPVALIQFEAPAPMALPAVMKAASDEDWPAIVHNREIEVIKVLNVINPVAAFVTAGFEQYGDRFSEVLKEEWQDTQEQLGKALKMYESCKQRQGDGKFDKKLALDMEETWQLLVKTGVAGVRSKAMVEAEVRRLTGA